MQYFVAVVPCLWAFAMFSLMSVLYCFRELKVGYSCPNPGPLVRGHPSSLLLLLDCLWCSVWIPINLIKQFPYFLVVLYVKIRNCDTFLGKGCWFFFFSKHLEKWVWASDSVAPLCFAWHDSQTSSKWWTSPGWDLQKKARTIWLYTTWYLGIRPQTLSAFKVNLYCGVLTF